MTTIAYDGKMLAGDTRYVNGAHLHGLIHKLWRLPNGAVMAHAGYVGLAFRLKDAIIKRQKASDVFTKKELQQLDAILIDRDGQGYYLDEKYGDFLPFDDPVYAIGSGEEIAIAAMKIGMSAADAVKLVSKAHITTNDIVDIYNIETEEFTLAEFPKYEIR